MKNIGKINSEAFSRREWLMLFALVLMIEAGVLNAGYVFKTQQDVINYVSFAATIASLLLAVIAIIYGYFQSDGQQKAAAAIGGQVESMQAMQAELRNSSSGIGNQISEMAITANALQKLTESLESAKDT